MQFKSFMEALKGNQHKLDKNKNGKLGDHDFKLLRKEDVEQADESFEFNRAALAKQRLMNLRKSGKRVRGASVANLMRAAGIREEEMDDEDLDQLDEVLTADAKASDWIHDFVHSTNPKFEGKTKKERIKMALGAYYGKQREKDGRVEEEVQQIDEISSNLALKVSSARLKRVFNDPQNQSVHDKFKRASNSATKRIDRDMAKDPERTNRGYASDADNNTKRGWSNESVEPPTGDLKDACWKGYTAVGMKMKNGKKVPNCVPVKEETDTSEKHEMAETQLHFIKYAAEEILEYIKMGGEIEEWYQNKLSKVQSEVESLHSYIEGESRRTGLKEAKIGKPVNVDKIHSAGQEPHEEKFETFKKKTVKEEFDEDGNITYEKVSFKQFTEQLLEYTPGPGGVTRVTGRGYGSAKGAKYGNTDYDKEHLDAKDDEGENNEPQKRGRGRPAGAKSGARGPRIK
jgi:hypothetical protein